ncbi:MAG: hypothetical protein EHM84_02070 [Lysobacterales bacterium]|nr:MAG: hypothetical protein EHM84_02070 [Xanthomonadales bacterium]
MKHGKQAGTGSAVSPVEALVDSESHAGLVLSHSRKVRETATRAIDNIKRPERPERSPRALRGGAPGAYEHACRQLNNEYDALKLAMRRAWAPAFAYAATVEELAPMMVGGVLSPADVVRAALKARDDERHEVREDVRTEKLAAATMGIATNIGEAGERNERGLYAVADAILVSGINNETRSRK